MSATESRATCPLLPLTELELESGEDALAPADQARLEAHLAAGCPVCEGRFEDALEGLGGGALEEVEGALDAAGEAMDQGRERVLARVRAQVVDEERATQRRVRRRLQRIVFYVTLLLLVALLVMTFVGLRFALRLEQLSAQRAATDAELEVLQHALVRYVQDGHAVPARGPALLEALASPRQDGAAPYFRFDPARLRRERGEYLDQFGRPYRYRAERGRALIYSLGADGVLAEPGPGDDLVRSIQFVH